MQTSIRAIVVFTLLTGLIYPLLVLGIGQVLFPYQANGSLLPDGAGSELIGQYENRPEFFHGRPSATSPKPYNAEASSGSNLGPLHPDRNALDPASGSGLDPHISPADARRQVARIREARRMPAERLEGLIERYTEPPQFGLLGEPRVNVLKLNQALSY